MGISSGAQSIYYHGMLFQQEKKPGLGASKIAHYLGSFLVVHNLGVERRGESL